MSHDLYVNYPCNSKGDVNILVGNTNLDIPTRIALLAGALPKDGSVKDYARTGERNRGGYKSLVFDTDSNRTRYAREVIEIEKKPMEQLGI